MPLVPVASTWAWQWVRVQPCRLIWDGQAWPLAEQSAADEAPAVQLAPHFDLEAWRLLRTDGRILLPFARRPHASHWTQLRATLVTDRPHNPGP